MLRKTTNGNRNSEIFNAKAQDVQKVREILCFNSFGELSTKKWLTDQAGVGNKVNL